MSGELLVASRELLVTPMDRTLRRAARNVVYQQQRVIPNEVRDLGDAVNGIVLLVVDMHGPEQHEHFGLR